MTTNINSDIEEMKVRNVRVEADKAWETSWSRRLFIALFTYLIAFLYMSSVGLGNPVLGAFVPSGGYVFIDSVSTFHEKFLAKQYL